MIRRGLKYKLSIIAFILPAMLLYIIVICYPILQTLIKSFFDWDGISLAVFIGLKNYAKLIIDPDVYISLKNGIIFSLVICVYQIGMGTLLAFAISSKKIIGKKIFKSSYFIPVILSTAVVAQLWLSIYHSEHGLLNHFFQMLGLNIRQNFLSNMKFGIIAIAFVNAWQFMGYFFILLYTGIKSISGDVLEAALIDGASEFQSNILIKMPLLAEIYKFCLILSITGGLKAFTEIYIMTGGGPGTANYTLSLTMYKAAFRMNDYGYGCTIAIALVLECVLATGIINSLVAKERLQ